MISNKYSVSTYLKLKCIKCIVVLRCLRKIFMCIYIYLFFSAGHYNIHSVHLIALNELHLNYFLNILNQLDRLTNDFKWLSVYCILVFIFLLTANILLNL